MANNKKRAGAYNKSKIKTSEFLPGVFQTNINKRWLDSTLDQMVSKSDLTHIEGFIGKKSGRYATADDIYIEPTVHTSNRTKAQFSPSIVTKKADGSLDNAITFDDISNAIASNFSQYNYNAAYASDIYGYYPPINVDKFINYLNYYWIEELPVYESYYDTAPTLGNPVFDANGRLTYTLTDDNNSFELEDNMLIKFAGDNWDPAIQANTYIVTGVGNSIKLLKYKDALDKRYYTSAHKGDVTISGMWDNSNYYSVTPNTASAYWSPTATPQDMVDAFNNDPLKLPIFNGFVFTDIESNPTQYTTGVLIKFTGGWDISALDKACIYYTELDAAGFVNLRKVVEAEYDINNNIVTNLVLQLPQENDILNLLKGWDTEYWDYTQSTVISKDYFVIAKDDVYQTAWSRNNNWVNISTIYKMKELLGDSFIISDYLNSDRIAQRPIIEMAKDMALWNFSNDDSTVTVWQGMVDFIIDPTNNDDFTPYATGTGTLTYYDALAPKPLPVLVGSTIIFKIPTVGGDDYKYIFRLESNGDLTQVALLYDGDTVFIKNTAQESMILWNDADTYYNGVDWELGQQKTGINQPPLYKLYNSDNVPLEDITGSVFAGSKVFGYKIGTGSADSVLGIPLSYKDSVKGAEYEFENFILTEKYYESYTSSIDRKISHYRTIPGYYFFKKTGALSHVYTKSDIITGTKESHIYEIQDTSVDLIIPYGYQNWRPYKEFLIYEYNDNIRLTEIFTSGVYLEKPRQNINKLVIGTNQSVVIHNLYLNSDISFVTANGYDIENPPVGVDMPDIAISRNGINITITAGDANSEIVRTILTRNSESVHGPIVVINKDADALYHDVLLNGTVIALENYTINSDSIVIGKDLLAIGDLVDFEYYTAQPLETSENTSIPQTMELNPTNEVITTFTIGETVSHWKSIILGNPGLTGDPLGYNNYSTVIKQADTGGNIFTHADLSIMHDVSYSNAALDITGALIEQAADWDNFITRFKSQVKRLYSTKTYTNVYELVNDTIDAIIINRKGGALYNNSNMVFSHRHNYESFTLEVDTTIVYSKYIMNGDDNIRDHMYVYLTDDRDSNGLFIDRLLTKDVDYNIVGNRINLLVTPIAHTVTSTRPVLKVYYHQMDEESYVPPSPVKLKLQNAYVPTVVGNILITHDGRQIELAANAELENTASANFDPVNAAVYDLEKRIYAGLVNVDKIYGDSLTESVGSATIGAGATVNNYASVYSFLPAQHRGTWYTLDIINEYIEKFYKKWAHNRNISDLNIDTYYNPVDPFTWNYSSIIVDEHFSGNTLPGHWMGAYTVLFGTHTPHITPWHMFGLTFKPTWWDEYYSWTDPVKRANLLKSLKYGVIDKPVILNEIPFQDMQYARYYWDWDNNCPVTITGELAVPTNVLGTPGVVNAAQPFVFGDWGPVEQQWRFTSQGHNALVDAIVKLNPTRAWSEFFQPGTIAKSANVASNLQLHTDTVATIANFKIPGKVYDSVVGSIYFKNVIDHFADDPYNPLEIQIADGENTVVANTVVSYLDFGAYNQDGVTYRKITGISLVNRGGGFVNPPAVKTPFTDAQLGNTAIEVILKQVQQVTSGISQAQYNYIIRNQMDVDLEQIYSTLNTQLSQKIGGFTSKHLVNMVAESSIIGAFKLTDSDYSLNMYRGYPTEIVTASVVNITKTLAGYAVSGVSSQEQSFKFYEPDLSATAGVVNVSIGATSVRKYKKFAGLPSTAQYNTIFAKIQDTYNFVRGYWHWMELAGYTLGMDGDAQATAFVQWAISADNGDSLTLDIGNNIQFDPLHGVVAEYNTLFYHKNDILDGDGNIIESNDLSVDRMDGTVSIKTKESINFGSVTSAILDYEHIVLLNNASNFGNVTIFDPVKNVRYNRLFVTGQITSDWNGERRADGYLVFDDHVVQNFDSSVSAIDDYYRTDVTEFNPALTKTKDLTIGNISRDWMVSLGLSKNTITNFYQGLIKNSGTASAGSKIGRSSVLDHGTTVVTGAEQYMFNHSYLGEDKLNKHIEIQLSQTDLNSNPQIIKFSELEAGESSENILVYAPGDSRIVFAGNPAFETIALADSSISLLTAGEALATETDYYITNLDQMATVFEDVADYATIPTWDSMTSYKFGDIVRHVGAPAGLYKCSVDYTGLLVVNDGVDVIGTVTNPIFPNGTVANIAGTTTAFNTTTTSYNTILAQGTVSNPTLEVTDTLTIDGVAVGFVKQVETTVVVGDAEIVGIIAAPTLSDVTGHFITINGTVVNFDTTPADIIENFVGVDNGIFPIVDLETTFTISQTIGGVWIVSQVTVDAVTQVAGVDYTIVGQDLVFTTGPAAGADIVVTIAHTPVSMSSTQIVNAINNAAITGVVASLTLDVFSRLVLTFSTTSTTEFLVLSSNAVTNPLLGFESDGVIIRPLTEVQLVNDTLTLTDIVTQINNTLGLPAVTASESGSFLLLTSANTTMLLTGTAVALLGMQTSYTATTSTVPTYSSMLQAVQYINATLVAESVTDVVVTVDNNRIKISTTSNSLLLGETSFNSTAGLPTGEVVSISDIVQNEFNVSDWEDITDVDPALISVWVADDSKYEINEVDGVVTKFYGWNVFQAQNEPRLYSVGTDIECGICAGTATRDGNDAEVTVNVDHNLQVGDYVMLLNTTTVPNIDGIHKVTRLGTSSTVFYIDRFIEECGNAASILIMRTQRFNTIADRDTATASINWNIPKCSLAWTNYDESAVRTTNVYNLCDTAWAPERKTTERVTNADLSNAVVYDTNTNTVVAEFEIFDPLRGIIPGVADKELDFKTVFDPAAYNQTTDETYTTDENDAWETAQVGDRWWDMSQARYYDYDQGPLSYRAAWWGKGFSDSEIVVWEWTKSTVAPDDYEKAVAGNVEMFGATATGQAYNKFDEVSNEKLYYYTQTTEWDSSQGKYRDVYYFWVKNKETLYGNKHTIPARSVAEIIADPSANGIGWVAAISSDAIIISNVNYYLTDNSTVLQINKKISGHAHNSWMLLAKDRDIVPEYWYIGLRNNLAGVDANDIKIPALSLHPLNRYGDDRLAGQAWFNDIRDARYNATLAINSLLSEINLIEDYKSTWDRTISSTYPLGGELAGELILPKRMWAWADFVSADFNQFLYPTYEITSTAELDSVNVSLHQVVHYEIIDAETDLDRSEIYAYDYTTGVWKLVKKNNSTIAFDPLQLSLTHGWDTMPWDVASWDNTHISDYWRIIVDACRFDIFVGEQLSKFNQLFFIMVDYTLSKLVQPNWIHKSTYITLDISSEIETTSRIYKRNQISQILGYVDTVKPFHTKVSNISDIYYSTENVRLAIEEDSKKAITLDIKNLNQNFVGLLVDASSDTKQLVYPVTGKQVYPISQRDASLNVTNWAVGSVVEGATVLTAGLDYYVLKQNIVFEVTPVEPITVNLVPAQVNITDGGSFIADDTQYQVEYNTGAFIQPYNYTNTGSYYEYQSTMVDIRPIELLNILVQTNRDGATVTSETRTFLYLQNNNKQDYVYGLEQSKATATASDLDIYTATVELVDGSAFAVSGFAYLNSEIIKFDRTGNTLYIRQRGLYGTFINLRLSGSVIVDITSTILSSVTANAVELNLLGLSILDSFGNIEPTELSLVGQGLEI